MSSLPFIFTTIGDTQADLIIGKDTLGQMPIPLPSDEIADLATLIRNIQFWHNGSVAFLNYNGVVLFMIDSAGNVTLPGNISASGNISAKNGNFTGTVMGQTATFTTFSSNAKLFDIPHPLNASCRLRHGSLEGPEFGVYVRGKSWGGYISLPDYWSGLVDEDSITVQLTATQPGQELFVIATTCYGIQISNNISGAFYYFVQAERKDIPELVVES